MDIRKGTGSSVLLNIKGDQIREGTGSKTLLNIKGDEIREGTSSSVIINIRGNDISARELDRQRYTISKGTKLERGRVVRFFSTYEAMK